MGNPTQGTPLIIVCTKLALLGMAGTRTTESCGQHAKDRMVNIRNKSFTHGGCGKNPVFGVTETKPAEYCALYSPDAAESGEPKATARVRRLRQEFVVWSRRNKNGEVLRTTRPGRDGQRLQQETQNRTLRQAADVRFNRNKNGGVLR